MPYRPTAATRATRDRRVRALLEAARQIVATEGFGAAGVRAVAAAAGVSSGTVYTCFHNREELLARMFREVAEVELAAVRAAVQRAGTAAGDPAGGAARAVASAQLVAVVETFARRAIRGRRLAWALLVEPVDPLIDAERLYFRRAYSDTLAEIVERGIARGELPEQDPRLVGPGLVGAIGEALTGPLSPLDHSAMTPDEVVDAIGHLCLRAVGAAPAPDA